MSPPPPPPKVTQKLPPPQDLTAAAVKGWGALSTAWLGAAQRWWMTILEWAYDECAYTGVNQAVAYTMVDHTTPLRGDFYRVGDKATALIPSTSVTIGLTTDAALATGSSPNIPAGAPTGAVLLVITINPGGAVTPGGYRGKVVDVSTGKAVAESIFIYVATSA